MIHNTLGTTINIIGTTEESRVNTSIPSSNIRFLVKITNDYSGAIQYAYGLNQVIKSRYTKFDIEFATDGEIYEGTVNLSPSGYWTYKIYEVSYIASVPVLDITNAPKTEVTVLPVADENGVVEGQVDMGKLHVHLAEGQEEVSYIKLDSVSDNYIYPYGETSNVVTGDKHFKFTQIAASTSWFIEHNLQKFPSVDVVDSGGTRVIGEVSYHNINTLTVSFTGAFGGEAYLN